MGTEGGESNMGFSTDFSTEVEQNGYLIPRVDCVILPGQGARLSVQQSEAPCLPGPGPASGPESAEESLAAAHSHCAQAPSLSQVTKYVKQLDYYHPVT